MDIHKELYQLLQCLHHSEKTNQNQTPKALNKKQNELRRFIKPAQITETFKRQYETITQKYITDSIKLLNNHYEARISELLGYLRTQRIARNTVQVGAKIAIRWANKNFGKKLTKLTVDKFNVIIDSIPPSFPNASNSTNSHRSNQDTTTPKSSTAQTLTTTQNTPRPQTHSDSPAPGPSYSSIVQGTTSTNTLPATQQTPRKPDHTNSENSPQSTHSSPQSSPSPPRPYFPTLLTTDNTFDVQGYTNPLSNFFPCTFTYNHNTFISAEHAFQHAKSEFYGEVAFGARVKQAASAGLARQIGKEIDKKYYFHEKGHQWNGRKQHVMADILNAKSKQCADFRKTLLDTGDKILTHNVPDEFWGSWHQRDGKMFEGRNTFAQILAKLRTQMMRSQQPTPGSPTPGTSKTTPPRPTQRPPRQSYPNTPGPVSTSNRFTPLTDETQTNPGNTTNPDIASSPESDTSPSIPNPKRRRINSPQSTPTTATGPQVTVHRERSRWRLPQLKSQMVVLGDSNLSRANYLETKVRSIELHSFPGANIRHFENLLNPSLHPQNTPKEVVLSIGINNRTNRASEQQLKNMINNASKTFPNASIHIPLINIPPEIPAFQQTNITHLNNLIQSLSHNQPFQTIPKLPEENFNIDPRDSHKIHWSTETANAIITHWTSHLNYKEMRQSRPHP